MTITVDTLRTWSEQLAKLPPMDPAAALPALGVQGALVNKTGDYAIVEPAPPGASRFALSVENLGPNAGRLGSVEVTLAGSPITRGDLERRFGSGVENPRVDYNRPYAVSYRVQLAGAPFRTTLVASFAEQPTPDSQATKILLRRDSAVP